MMKRSCAILIAVLLSALAAEPATAQPQTKTWNKPLYRDDRLDFCLNWGESCGKPAANAFCLRKRYAEARDFPVEENVSPTRLIGSKQRCISNCDSFASVTCVRPIRDALIITNPTVGATRQETFRVDACLNWLEGGETTTLMPRGKDCGQPAADEVCKRSGFANARAFELDEFPGEFQTKFIGSNVRCYGPHCTGFQQIICRDYIRVLGRSRPVLNANDISTTYRQLYRGRASR
jgi:hypothetical protein